MGYYKFLRSEYIDKTLKSGQIRFGRLLYYRLLEHSTGDQWIGDRLEGLANTVVNLKITADNPNQSAKKILHDKNIISMVDAASLEMRNAIIKDDIDCYIYSFSYGDVLKLKAVMSDPKRPDYAYDACIQIADGEVLYRAIKDWGEVTRADGTGATRLSDHFHVGWGYVRYGSSQFDFNRHGIAPADPLKKDSRYREQAEVRVILGPKHRTFGDFVRVSIKNPNRLFREMYRDNPIPKAASTMADDVRSEAELLELLRAAAEFISKRYSLGADHFETEELFDESYRMMVCKAWMKLRQVLPSSKMDRAIANSYNLIGLKRRIEDYLSGDLDGPGPTPLGSTFE